MDYTLIKVGSSGYIYAKYDLSSSTTVRSVEVYKDKIVFGEGAWYWTNGDSISSGHARPIKIYGLIINE